MRVGRRVPTFGWRWPDRGVTFAVMTGRLKAVIATTYVRDLDASRAFYEYLGFREERSGASPEARWSVVASGDHRILLVSASPPLAMPQVPLLFYFYFSDLAARVAALRAAGLTVEDLGHPEHSPGGEVKVIDPDGNAILAGQQVPSQGAAAPPAGPDPSRFSLLKEAAAAVAQRGTPRILCQVSGPQWVPCGATAEVRIADSAGDTVWVCLAHADDILVSVPGAFIASPEEGGIAAFLANRHGSPSPPRRVRA